MTRLFRGLAIACALAGVLSAQGTGSIRGLVLDKDLDVPLGGAEVLNIETGQRVTTSDQGNYLIEGVPPGRYTLAFSKVGYLRMIRGDVLVQAGQLTEVDVALAGDFTDLEEFVVQDVLQVGTSSEAALLQLRFESPALLDSIGADLMSKAGASDAAQAMRLVAGATVKDGKSAVIRGLPDRYVSSQVNFVRLPSADEDKRAVELDQFPAAVVESIQVSKTFTPDQQGDASGGAVNVVLRGIPEEFVLQSKVQLGYNTNVGFGDDFLGYQGGGFDFFGNEDEDRGAQPLGTNWSGGLDGEEESSPIDWKFSFDIGNRVQLSDEWRLGGFLSVFYERDSSFYDDGRDDNLWRLNPGEGLTPQFEQGTPNDGDFRTSQFDVIQGTRTVKLGTLAAVGLESERHSLGMTYLFSRSTLDRATVATDTRSKEFFYPGYDPDDPLSNGHQDLNGAPYLRTDTIEFTKREVDTLQLTGSHVLRSGDEKKTFAGLEFEAPELDWGLAHSSATSDQPDKRQFAATWAPFGATGIWQPYKPAAAYLLGNLQRTFKNLEEVSDQYRFDLELPYTRKGLSGFAKVGVFDDAIEREYRQESFSNFGDNSTSFGEFEDPWSDTFLDENHPITDGPPFLDVDYDGEQDVSALYAMTQYPLREDTDVVFGWRWESTKISTQVFPEADATWLNPDGITQAPEDLDPGEADSDFSQDDVLPALGFTWRSTDTLTLRGAFAKTVARQTFKEITPILQQEYAGAPVFVGNPGLRMASLDNYDLRLEYVPDEGSMMAASWFFKSIDDPIEYVQKVYTFSFTQPENYPEGKLSGFELETRQSLEPLSEKLEGLGVGANATFIHSEVDLPEDEVTILENQGIFRTSRDATNAPEHLFNLFATWEIEHTGTNLGLFYTITGDTLLAGAGAQGLTTNYVPSIYQAEYGTLNFSLSQRLNEHSWLEFQAKNLTNPDIETVYREPVIGDDVTKSSYSQGIELSLSLKVRL
jgi:TonB-dependent receptor